MHSNSFGLILLELAFVTLLGIIGRALARGLKRPAVVGELALGILAVNIAALGEVSLTRIVTGLQDFSQLGGILLLFTLGLKSRVADTLRVGRRVLIVAGVGLLGSFTLGMGCALWLIPEAGLTVHIFIVAVLGVTSMRIPALSNEGKIIRAAATIGNVVAMILLAVVTAMASSSDWDISPVLKTLGVALGFILASVIIGPFIIRRLIEAFEFLDPEKFKLFFTLSFCFALAWLATQLGLPAILGAFVAGLIVNDEDFKKRNSRHESIDDWIGPISGFFVPVFFVTMGLQINLAIAINHHTLMWALAFSLVAIGGKLICGLVAGPLRRRWVMAWGMVSRGEVGLMFAAFGKGLGILDDYLFTAIVLVVVATTVITNGDQTSSDSELAPTANRPD